MCMPGPILLPALSTDIFYPLPVDHMLMDDCSECDIMASSDHQDKVRKLRYVIGMERSSIYPFRLALLLYITTAAAAATTTAVTTHDGDDLA